MNEQASTAPPGSQQRLGSRPAMRRLARNSSAKFRLNIDPDLLEAGRFRCIELGLDVNQWIAALMMRDIKDGGPLLVIPRPIKIQPATNEVSEAAGR